MPSRLSHFRLRRGTALAFLLLATVSQARLLLPAQLASGPLSACRCDDIPRLKDRLQKLLGIEKLIARKLQSVSSNAPATQADWDSLQSQINSYLRALQMQNLTDFPDTSLFPYQDPACALSGAPAESCSEQEDAVHQQGHAASCRAGKWSWQSPWLAVDMLHEESAALQAEIDALKDTIDHLQCAPCPQFLVTVQVVTTTAFSGSGLNERSSRSLNNGQGIQVPLTLQANGILAGAGSGIDAGSAQGSTRGETVSGQFGHMQSIYATATIQPGTCSSPPCPGDIMHLTLTGGPSRQITEMQARGVVNRDFNQTTPSGGATLSFDLPAYVGSSVRRTLLANSLENSAMVVTLGQLSTGPAALPDGSSLLYSLEHCRGSNSVAGTNPPPNTPPSGGGGGSGGGSGGGGGGGSGIVSLPNGPVSGSPPNAPTTPPLIPEWIKTTVIPSGNGIGQIKVDWSAAETATSYNVYRNLIYPDAAPNEQVFGVSGNITTFTDTTAPLFIAAEYSVTAVNSEGESGRRNAPATRAVATPDAAVWGFADTHTHPFVDRAFGSGLFWGRPFGPMDTALQECSSIHSTKDVVQGADAVGMVLGGIFLGPIAAGVPVVGPALDLGLDKVLGDELGQQAAAAIKVAHPGTKGAPKFEDWPRFDTKVHQLMYESWLYRAYVGGLRLMVAHAVNNETLCAGLKALGRTASGRTCDDMEAVNLQLQDARDMESFINSECANGAPELGCVAPGVGWFHVVTSSTEARQTINRGQLAVVLGIEVDHLFGCGRGKNCIKADVDQGIQAAIASGVRHIFPIHLSDNAFGGMALYSDMFAVSSWFLNGVQVNVEECPVDATDGAYTFRLTNYPQAATCNAEGLSDLGKYMVQNLASRHIIIDVDHMSRKSVEDTFTLLQPFSYPVIAGHNGFMVLRQGGARTEAARTTGQAITIKSLGGLVSIGLGDVGSVADVGRSPYSSIPDDCSNSSKSWFQSYSLAAIVGGGWPFAAVPLSTDQGLTDMIGPRFKGSLGVACPGGTDQEVSVQKTPITYPFKTLTPGTHLPMKKSSVNGREFDFNTEGFAHFGLFPDFVADLQSLGATEAELGPLFRSAEGYLQMWSRAEAANVPIPAEHDATPVRGSIQIHVQSGSNANDAGTNVGTSNSWVIVNATDSLTGVAIAGTVSVNGQSGAVTGSTGQKITFKTCYRITGTGSSRTTDVVPCLGHVAAPGYSTVSFNALQ